MGTRFLPLALLVVLLPLAACGDDDDGGTVAADRDATTTTEAAADAEPVVYLDPTGLFVDADEVPFGTDEVDVVNALTVVLGNAAETGQEDECPAGETFYVRFGQGPEDISLDFQDDAFVGWSIGAGSALATQAGIGMGSSKADLEEAYGPIEVDTTSTIGNEFLIPSGLGGVLDEDSPDGVISALWAGTTCIYR